MTTATPDIETATTRPPRSGNGKQLRKRVGASTGGRPSKLSPASMLAAVLAARAGKGRRDQARAAKVAPSVLFTWIADGRAGKSADTEAFVLALEQAERDRLHAVQLDMVKRLRLRPNSIMISPPLTWTADARPRPTNDLPSVDLGVFHPSPALDPSESGRNSGNPPDGSPITSAYIDPAPGEYKPGQNPASEAVGTEG